MKNTLAENLLRFGVKNLSESAYLKIQMLLEQTETKTLEKTITFPSGKHSAVASNIAGILDPQLAEIQKFLQDNQASSKIVSIDLQAGESQVPNYDTEVKPKKKLIPGDLSKLRYSTIETYMQAKIAEWQQQNIINPEQTVTFNKLEPVIGKTLWNPPANATPEQISKLAADLKYTNEQFMRMYIKVVSETQPSLEPVFTKTLTTRESIAKTAGSVNAVFFYNYSIAAAAILGADYKTLPSQLLTMNKYFANKVDINIESVVIPKVTIRIEPNGGQDVALLVLESRTSLQKWTARVADTYNLIIPFKEGTAEWKGAWLFACWYITGKSQLNDWSLIANKPSNIDFNPIFKIQRPPLANIESPQYQLNYFSQKGEFLKNFGEEGETFVRAYKRLISENY